MDPELGMWPNDLDGCYDLLDQYQAGLDRLDQELDEAQTVIANQEHTITTLQTKLDFAIELLERKSK